MENAHRGVPEARPADLTVGFEGSGVRQRTTSTRSSASGTRRGRWYYSNRAIEEWPALFGDALLSSAALDRMVHHAHVIVIKGKSYRAAKSLVGTRATVGAK